MININTIRSDLQTKLNAISDREFAIFSDVNDFLESSRSLGSNDITRYVNGIMEAMQPSIMPIKNLEIQTQSFRVTFVLDFDALTKDENGNYTEVSEIRGILETYIKQNNAIPFYLAENSKNFEVTPSFGGITVGLATQMSPIGDVLPMYFDFSCVFVESGVNTNTINFIINGENMFFQEYSISRTRTAETNMVANEKSQKTLIQANGISINLKMPLLNTTQSQAIENDVLNGGQNEAVCVERVRPGANNTEIYNAYIMIYGNNAESGQIGQNIGQVVDLVEGKQNELIYGTGWGNDTFNAVTGSLEKTLNLPQYTNAVVIFWGDGSIDKVKKNTTNPVTTKTHTYAIGSYTIRYFSY